MEDISWIDLHDSDTEGYFRRYVSREATDETLREIAANADELHRFDDAMGPAITVEELLDIGDEFKIDMSHWNDLYDREGIQKLYRETDNPTYGKAAEIDRRWFRVSDYGTVTILSDHDIAMLFDDMKSHLVICFFAKYGYS